jgi:hypothetical protein
MKKITILISVLLLVVSFQATSQVPRSICVKPGISKAYLKFSDSDKNYSYPESFYAGINLEFMQHKYFSILAEGGFTTKSDHFIYISPLFKARMEFGRFVPYAYVGPRLDFLVTTYSQRQSEGYQYYNTCVFGLSYGLGLELLVKPFGFVAGFQHQYDLTNVLNEKKMDVEGINYKHSTLVFSLGLKAYFGDHK